MMKEELNDCNILENKNSRFTDTLQRVENWNLTIKGFNSRFQNKGYLMTLNLQNSRGQKALPVVKYLKSLKWSFSQYLAFPSEMGSKYRKLRFIDN